MNVDKMSMHFESKQYPSVAYTPSFPQTQADRKLGANRLFREFLRLMGLEGKDSSSIDLFDFCHGNSIFCFNMSYESAELSEVSTREALSGTGYLRFNCSFETPPLENFQLWLMPIYASQLHIAPDSVVSLDYFPSIAM